MTHEFKASPEELQEQYPEWTQWCDDNGIPYYGYGKFLSSTGETDYIFCIRDETHQMAFKLRWD